MKTSVAMATYNGEKYIEEQLQSILDQTLPVDEVIIVDDVSQDHTVEIVNRFIGSHGLKNWICVVNERNLGYGQNFRKAIDLICKENGEDRLIFLADQDDYWVKDRVERMTAEMNNDPKIGVLNTHQQTFFGDEKPWHGYSHIDDAGKPKRIDLTPHTRFLRSLGCEMVFRKSFYDQMKQYWYNGWAHDEFLWSVAMLFGACYEWDYVSLYRRLHEKQVSGHMGHSKENRVDYLRGVKQSSEYLLNLSEKKEMPDDVRKLFRNNVKTHQLRLDLIQNRKLTNAFKLIPYIRYYYAPKSFFVELAMTLKG